MKMFRNEKQKWDGGMLARISGFDVVDAADTKYPSVVAEDVAVVFSVLRELLEAKETGARDCALQVIQHCTASLDGFDPFLVRKILKVRGIEEGGKVIFRAKLMDASDELLAAVMGESGIKEIDEIVQKGAHDPSVEGR